MRQAARTARYDQALGLEAYSLRAVDRPFPSHFHDHYVIGVVERGTRTLTCGRQRQVIGPGDVLLFNPGDSHACIQADGALDYRGLNIPRSTMLALAEEIMGSRAMPGFSVAVVRDGELAGRLRALHRAVLGEEPELRREEALLLAWGLDEFSVSASSILATKRSISLWSAADAAFAEKEAMKLSAAESILGCLGSMKKE